MAGWWRQRWLVWSTTFLVGILGSNAPAFGQFPENEVSFEGYQPYYQELIGNISRIRMSEPPTINCIGLPPITEEQSSRAPVIAANLEGPAAAAVSAFRAGQYEDSIRLLKPSIDRGDPASEYALGCVMDALAHARFEGPQDRTVEDPTPRAVIERAIQLSRTVGGQVRTALYWLNTSAEAGFLPARWELARRWSDRMVRHPKAIAVHWMRVLAAGGDARAMALLGSFYMDGLQVPRDLAEGNRLIAQSAQAGDQFGMLMLAEMFRDGRAGRRDDAEAVRWLERLAATGDAEGQYYLALALRDGEGVAADRHRAAELLRAASDQGHAAASYELALLYRSGSQVMPDAPRAQALLEDAARRGNCDAKLAILEGQIAAAAIDRSNDEAVQAALRPVDSCERDWRQYTLRDSPFVRRPGVANDRAWRARVAAARSRLGIPEFDIEGVQARLTGADRQAASATVAALATMAGSYEQRATPSPIRIVNGQTHVLVSFDERQNVGNRAQALAILAFPAAWLPTDVRAQIDSAHWRAFLQRLPLRDRAEVAEFILRGRLTSQDLPAILSLIADDHEDSDTNRSSILRELGLVPAAFSEIIDRIARNSNPQSVSVDEVRLSFSCSYTDLYSAFVSRMDRFRGDCNGVEDLAQLPPDQLQRLSDLGFGIAELYLAMAYLEGRTVEADAPHALRLLYDLRGGLSTAIRGVVLEEGRGVAPDPAQAATYFSQAFTGLQPASLLWREDGAASVAAHLGPMLLEGRGLPADPERGVAMLEYAAGQGVIRGETGFGDALFLGLGVASDEAEALRWYRQATAAGDATAMIRLGFLAANGLWNERGLGSRRWYELATLTADSPAMLDLARASAFGPHPDIVEVRHWLNRASARNNGWARSWLIACGGGSLDCFRQQPDFARRFFTSVATRAGEHGARAASGSGAPDARLSATRLQQDRDAINARLDAAVALDQGRGEISAALSDLELTQTYHGDADGAISSRLRRLLLDDSRSSVDYGSLSNYFALIRSSCEWGHASELAQALGRPQAALFFAKTSVNRLQEARSYLVGLNEEIRECFLDIHQDRYRWLADLLIRSGRLAEAESVLGMLKDFEQANYTRDAARRRSSDRALSFSQEEESLNAQIDTIRARYIPADGGSGAGERPYSEAQFRADFEGVVASVAALDVQTGQPSSGRRVEWLRSDQRSIMSDLRRRFPADTAVLHAVVLPDRMHWLLATREGRRVITITGPEGEIDSAVAGLLTAIQTRSPLVRERAQLLYERVFAPVDRELQRIGAQNIMLSLDMRLRYVPFAALHDGRQWLVERYNFSHFRRPEDYLRGGENRPWTIAAFGTTASYHGLDPLPSVVRELGGIVQTNDAGDVGIVPGVELLDSAFTRSALTNALAQDYRIIHIASHFVVDSQRAADSFLLLGDGSRLSLLAFSADGALTFSHADLVTLSACDTALQGRFGDGSEIDSMATIAQDAGAPAVIASLWTVSDDSTADLMTGFYRYRVRGHLSLSEALRRAQIDLLRTAPRAASPGETAGTRASRSSRDVTHPYYWAPFILMGNWQ